jgi:hypothetical protein
VPGRSVHWGNLRRLPLTGTSALARVASLWGLSVEELSAAKLDVADARFPLVACAHAEKVR